jgi:hypothetical protein
MLTEMEVVWIYKYKSTVEGNKQREITYSEFNGTVIKCLNDEFVMQKWQISYT